MLCVREERDEWIMITIIMRSNARFCPFLDFMSQLLNYIVAIYFKMMIKLKLYLKFYFKMMIKFWDV